MKKKKGEIKHICNECGYMRAVPSLFDNIQIVECSNGCYRTLNTILTGGGIEV